MRTIKMIGISVAFAIVGAGAIAAFSQSVPEPVYYSYLITGRVSDDRGRPLGKMFVFWIPAVRPIHGRIPWTLTAADGTYILAVKDVPDKYGLTASDRDIWIDVKKRKRNSCRTKSTEVLVFGPADETRVINFQFER